MKRHLLFFAWLAATVSGGNLVADDDAPSRPDRAAMVARVDELLSARWKELGIEPAQPVDDAEFLRRAYLDLTGVIPRVAEARAFLADERPDKRARLVDGLLVSPGHATHMANTWRNIVLPSGGSDPEQLNAVVGLQNWFRGQFVENNRYDRMVSDFLQATAGDEAGPALFYTALDVKPERVAADTSRIFLGLQIACAECHNHPFDKWTQQDFWGYAAFFARLTRPEQVGGRQPFRLVDADNGEVKLPGGEEIVLPKYPGGSPVDKSETGNRREQLAIWMASRDNPYLAKAAVNRVWAQLFGRGLVEPVDDLSKNNPPSHPELFDELTRYFVRSGFDLRELQRTLAATRAYQLASSHPASEPPPEAFACMAIKALTAEQLFDSLSRTLSRSATPNMMGVVSSVRLLDPRRQAFIAKMQSEARSALDYQSGIPQALILMNGGEIGEATSLDRGGLLAALEAPLFSDEERVETLFLATLSRLPDDAQREKFVTYVKYGGPTADRRQALGDVLWALLNSAEFGLNH